MPEQIARRRRPDAEAPVKPTGRPSSDDASPAAAAADDVSSSSATRPPRDPGKPTEGWHPFRSLRRRLDRAATALRRVRTQRVVRTWTHVKRRLNKRNARIAITALALAGLAACVVAAVPTAAALGGYAFAFLAGLFVLAVVRDVLVAGTFDLDMVAATAAFGALALYQLL